MLGEVAAVMAAAPEIQISVGAHLDDRSDNEAAKRLTSRIAAQVLEELVRRRVARERMEPIGWGGTKPIVRNNTAASRAKNRRVEFELKLDEDCRPLRTKSPSVETAGLDCR